jgi:hypothetical protein
MSQLNKAKTSDLASVFWEVCNIRIEEKILQIDKLLTNESDSLAQLFWNSTDSEYNPDQFVV